MATIYRVGDIVTVPEGVREVIRVGYKMHYMDFMSDGWLQMPSDLVDLTRTEAYRKMSSKLQYDMRELLAKAYVERNAFGGDERVVHYGNELEPGTYRVLSKKVRKTGVYFVGYPGCPYTGSEPTPSELRQQKSHVILTIEPVNFTSIFNCFRNVLASDVLPGNQA